MRALLKVVGWLYLLATAIGALVVAVLRTQADPLQELHMRNPTLWAREIGEANARLAALPSPALLCGAVAQAFVVACVCWGIAHVIAQGEVMQEQLRSLGATQPTPAERPLSATGTSGPPLA